MYKLYKLSINLKLEILNIINILIYDVDISTINTLQITNLRNIIHISKLPDRLFYISKQKIQNIILKLEMTEGIYLE